MERHDASVIELRRGVSYHVTDDPAAYDRANYVMTLHSRGNRSQSRDGHHAAVWIGNHNRQTPPLWESRALA
jgi:hypothetical protein